jgi:hypothetical protein
MGFEGRFSVPVQFVIDTAPPAITIETPKDKDEVDTEFVHIEGATKTGSTLTINNRQVIVDETGHFVSAVIPENGENEIVFSVRDRAGNTAKASITVYKTKDAKTGKQTKTNAKSFKEKSESFATTSLGILTITVIIGVIILILA